MLSKMSSLVIDYFNRGLPMYQRSRDLVTNALMLTDLVLDVQSGTLELFIHLLFTRLFSYKAFINWQ